MDVKATQPLDDPVSPFGKASLSMLRHLNVDRDRLGKFLQTVESI